MHLVADSVGAVYAFTLADESPELVETVTTVEGNFSLAGAFWSRSIAALSEADARASIEERLAAPDEFLLSDGIEPTGQHLALAKQALAFQPWQTVWESARAVVEYTGDPAYSTLMRPPRKQARRRPARPPTVRRAFARTSSQGARPALPRRARVRRRLARSRETAT